MKETNRRIVITIYPNNEGVSGRKKIFIKKLQIHIFCFCVILISTFHINNYSHAKLPKVIPEIQHVTVKKPAAIIQVDESWTIVVDELLVPNKSNSKDVDSYWFSVQEMKQGLSNIGVDLTISNGRESKVKNKRIIIGNPHIHPYIREICKQNKIDLQQFPYKKGDSRYEEGYVLDVINNSEKSGDIIIAANGPAGIFYGVQTFLQLIEKTKRIQVIRIVDYPDMKWRGYYVDFRSFRLPNNKPIGARLTSEGVEAIQTEIKKYVKYKINTIVFSGQPFDQLDVENLNHLKQIFDYSRQRFINPIPTIKSLLWGSAIKKFPEILASSVEGVWIKDEKFIIDDNGYAHPKIPLESVMLNGSFEIDQDSDEYSDHWIFNRLDQQNRWTVVHADDLDFGAKGVHSGEKAAKLILERPKDFSKLSLETDLESLGNDASLIPGSYYELGFWSRNNGKSFTRGKVFVEQYDAAERLIESVTTHYGFDFFPSRKYKKSWVPIFVHLNCSKLKILFRPSRSGNNTGNIFIDDVELVRMNGALVNVINNQQGDIIVTNLDGTIIYIQDKDYIIEKAPLYFSPQINIKNLEKTIIKILPGSDIKRMQEVRTSYDSLVLNPMHRNSRLCPSSPGTYKYYRDIFEKLMVLDVNFINIHMSEHQGGFNRDSRCLKRNKSNAELLSQFVDNLNNIIHNDGKVNVHPNVAIKGLNHDNVRLLMWDDIVNYWHNGGEKRGETYYLPYGGKIGATYLALSDTLPFQKEEITLEKVPTVHIPKDVILATWWYQDKDSFGILKNSPDFYEQIGFDYIGVTFDTKKNVQAWAKALSNSKSLGLMSSSWGGRKNGVIMSADYAWKKINKR